MCYDDSGGVGVGWDLSGGGGEMVVGIQTLNAGHQALVRSRT